MHRVLVTYATSTGCTRGVAEDLAAALRTEDVTVDLHPVDEAPGPEGYDAVVVGSGVRVGQWRKPARTWVGTHAAALTRIPVAFFTVGMILRLFPERTDEVRGYTDGLIEHTGVRPVDIGLFTGWNQPDEFGRAERLMLRAMKAPVGDFRDPAAVRAWAESLRAPLGLTA